MISILEFIDNQVCYEPELNKYSVNGKIFRRKGQAESYAAKLYRQLVKDCLFE